MTHPWKKKERRRYVRIEKHFIISYHDKNDPEVKHNVSQLKNISIGGMCFVTSTQYPAGTKMDIELKTPYIADTVYIEGTVLESHEKIRGIIYETRLVFDKLNSQATLVINKIVDIFLNITEGKK